MGYRYSERPKEQMQAGNYTGGKPVRNESGGVVGDAKYTGSSGNTQGRNSRESQTQTE